MLISPQEVYLAWILAEQVRERAHVVRRGHTIYREREHLRQIPDSRAISIEEALSYYESPGTGSPIRSLWLLPNGNLREVGEHFESIAKLLVERLGNVIHESAVVREIKRRQLVRVLVTTESVGVQTWVPLTDKQKQTLLSIAIRTRGRRLFTWESSMFGGKNEYAQQFKRASWDDFAKVHGI